MLARLAKVLTAAAVALALGGMVGPSSAGAATLGITVTPSTGLVDGQVVMISGTGFTGTPLNGGWVVAECRASILDQAVTLNAALENCGTADPTVHAVADAAGNFSVPFPVHTTVPFITGALGTLDCTATPCALLVAQVVQLGVDQFAFVGAAAPITFGDPLPPPCAKGDRPGHGYGDHHHCHTFRHQAHSRAG